MSIFSGPVLSGNRTSNPLGSTKKNQDELFLGMDSERNNTPRRLNKVFSEVISSNVSNDNASSQILNSALRYVRYWRLFLEAQN